MEHAFPGIITSLPLSALLPEEAVSHRAATGGRWGFPGRAWPAFLMHRPHRVSSGPLWLRASPLPSLGGFCFKLFSLFSLSLLLSHLLYLKSGEDIEITRALIHSPSGCTNQGWAMPMQELGTPSRSPTGMWGAQLPLPCCLQGANQAAMVSMHPGLKLRHSDSGQASPKRWLCQVPTPCTHFSYMYYFFFNPIETLIHT